MNYAIPLPDPVTLPVADSDAVFPVVRVFCVGRNYAEHAVEMGHDPDREPPFFFMKPAVAVWAGVGALPFPPATDDLHHEVELVVALRDGGLHEEERRLAVRVVAHLDGVLGVVATDAEDAKHGEDSIRIGDRQGHGVREGDRIVHWSILIHRLVA